MKKQLIKAVAAISFLVAIVTFNVRTTQAQSPVYRLTVRIPFEFIVGDKTLPAGEYSIGRMPQYASDNLLLINSKDGKAKVLGLVSSLQTLEPADHGVLVFHRYGDQNFLAEVWAKGSRTGRALPKSHSERVIEQQTRDSGNAVSNKAPAAERITIKIIGSPGLRETKE